MDNQKDFMLIETIVKVAALQKLLVAKNILTEQEIQDEMTSISKELVEQMKLLSPELFNDTVKN